MKIRPWKITNNFINTTIEINSNVKVENPIIFALYDGDGFICLQGEISKETLRNNPFEPLDEYGRTFGCVGIIYYESGKWENI